MIKPVRAESIVSASKPMLLAWTSPIPFQELATFGHAEAFRIIQGATARVRANSVAPMVLQWSAVPELRALYRLQYVSSWAADLKQAYIKPNSPALIVSARARPLTSKILFEAIAATLQVYQAVDECVTKASPAYSYRESNAGIYPCDLRQNASEPLCR